MGNGEMSVAVRDLQTLFGVGVTGILTDGQLLERFVARREGAVFETIIHRHGPMVWGVCRRVLRDHHDAEDAFQATFFVLARKAASIAHREKLGNWLFGVAHQTAKKARAKRAKRRGREGQVPDMPELTVVPDDQRDDLAESLDRELSRLPEKYRIPIVLCDLEGRTHWEAASQLGWPVGTVSSRLSRARALLARRLSRSGSTLSGGSLAVLLAQESASAGGMPTRLIGPTARAASRFAAGGAVPVGVAPAGVVALTGEVMKMMLLSKIQAVTAMLLVVSALAVGGTGLAFRAQADGPDQDQDPQRLGDPYRAHALAQGFGVEKGDDLQLGTWAFAGAPDDVKEPPEGGGHYKYFTGKHWCVTKADPETGKVAYHHGGTYTLDGDNLEETVKYSTEAGLIGQTFKYKIKVEGDTYTQTGVGNPYNEVWKRAK